MAKVLFKATDVDSIIKATANARANGKTWKVALIRAQDAGFNGSVTSLQKLVKAQPLPVAAAEPSGKVASGGYKNSATTTASTKAGANAFVKTTSDKILRKSSGKAIPETLESIQNRLPVLREGVQYDRPISLFDGTFHNPNDGEIVAWSRILGKEEAVCVTNSNTQYPRGADVLVDCTLNPVGSFMAVIHLGDTKVGGYSIGDQLPVQRRHDGTAFVSVRDVRPAATLVLSNMPVVIESVA